MLKHTVILIIAITIPACFAICDRLFVLLEGSSDDFTKNRFLSSDRINWDNITIKNNTEIQALTRECIIDLACARIEPKPCTNTNNKFEERDKDVSHTTVTMMTTNNTTLDITTPKNETYTTLPTIEEDNSTTETSNATVTKPNSEIPEVPRQKYIPASNETPEEDEIINTSTFKTDKPAVTPDNSEKNKIILNDKTESVTEENIKANSSAMNGTDVEPKAGSASKVVVPVLVTAAALCGTALGVFAVKKFLTDYLQSGVYNVS